MPEALAFGSGVCRRLRRGLWLAGLMLLALPIAARADLARAQQAFGEGKAHYQRGDYEAALDAYRASREAGYESAALYYNMGNAYFRLDEIGQAVLQYERARRLRPDDPLIRHNLEIARARTPNLYSSLPTPFWARAWRQAVSGIGAGTFYGIGLLLYVLAAGLIGYRIWTGRRPAWLRRSYAVSLTAGLCCIGLGVLASLDGTLGRSAVVLITEAPLRASPTPDASADVAVYEGLVVDVLTTNGPWVEVRLPNGATGWLATDALAEV